MPVIVVSKVHSINSTFASNYGLSSFSYKCELTQSDWHAGLAHQLGNVKMKYGDNGVFMIECNR